MSENFVFNALYGLLILTVVSFFVTILFNLLKIRVNPKLWKTLTHDEWLFIAGKRRGSMWTWIRVEKIWWIFYIERGEQFREDYRAFWHFKEAGLLSVIAKVFNPWSWSLYKHWLEWVFAGTIWISFGLIIASAFDFRFLPAALSVMFGSLLAHLALRIVERK